MTSLSLLAILTLFPFFIVALALYLRDQGHEEWVMRKLMHVSSILIVSLYVTLIPFIEALIVVLIFFGVVALLSFTKLRLLPVLFEMSTRQDEGSKILVINNILTTATLTIIYFAVEDQPWIFLTAALAVSFGDGLGEVISRPFGKHKYKVLGQKSLGGSLGVFVGTLIGGIFSFLLLAELTFTIFLVLLFVSLLVVAIEAVSIFFMDNVLIPIMVTITLLMLL